MNKRKYFYLGLIVVVAGLMVYTYRLNNRQAKNSNSTAVKGEAVNQAVENRRLINLNQQLNEEKLVGAEARDRKRINDLQLIRAALDQYRKDKGQYPENLIDASIYLSPLPENPALGGATYIYTPIGTPPYTFYTVSYVLETSIEGIEAGYHTATPEGLHKFTYILDSLKGPSVCKFTANIPA